MKQYFQDEHYMLQDMVRDFAANEVAPIAESLDKEERFPLELIPKLAELGLLGIPFPEEYGGAGMDTLAYSLVIEELAKVDSSVAITVAAHISLGTSPIYLFGSEEQKNAHLSNLISGKYLACFGLTEPEAGSDAGGTKTTAVRDGDEWVINGSKNFITNAGYSGVCNLTAVTDPEAKRPGGVSVFMVDPKTPGFIIGPPEKKMGWRGSDTRALTFENMRVPAGALLGELDVGFGHMMTALVGGRISVAALSLGLAEGALQAALKYADEREAFGKKIHRFQGVGMQLAEVATEIEAARHLVYQASYDKDHGGNVVKAAAMAKLKASETAVRAANMAVQVHGGYGYIKEFQVERFFRDAKVLTIGEGTSEVQKLVILKQLMKGL
ncbi:MAG: acyl-CoA dehydrogenase [Candidatus Marinimicrobia bacterium]|jgi:alkylation response protein AidB-like acyl-CoA dehydrogenase|nr:acyl-CoA dehydrogenase [Candidatus Neomarinimicrobiota bacterium]MBT3629708.1 acyl-CoA dehydrogenase [Candidatus Neomarinimicrobiota bacterium]MBT3824870.1 acyl-CoA dehydrogenase [Candidatus Neomarinimicrobiota bacterium]MBT4131313.1 acyl-CoA dehydrogenase [Candidatus Neomarinimicrobiota bacterium]MBT4294293.1 acyl-CoA dehydrogenase [Candidatus Neomarinimicrobiota bacterium]